MSGSTSAYITASGQHLPGPPVGNDAMADHIGVLTDAGRRAGRLFLRGNGIRTRHYAIRPDGTTDWTLATLGAAALDDLFARAEADRRAIGFLATATTQNDLLVPGLASGVHAESGLPPIEIASLQSVCASAMMALKYAMLQVRAGEHRAALALGAEFSSRYFRPGQYADTATPDAAGDLPADAEFLRWTLSDGAAGVLVEDRPAACGLSLRIDWVSLRSFADRFGPCMTGGAMRGPDGSPVPWSHAASIGDAARAGAFQLRQDVEALHRMLPVWLGELMRLVDEGRVDIARVDHFLCHFSARGLRDQMVRLATRAGCMIAEERWFTNLYDKGNVGAASLFLLIDDLLRSGRLSPGERVLCAVPESGQCVMGYAMMTVVEGR
ncbi:3-oxoacyl-[acyl-carrier-protein] synthase III C-terminal domain-containing protein [Sphingomonas sp. 2R-10]|uniref:3-oxoacyl-[acyl-carrier-protein] synthase III C-terminal domain-containing protein n=1 Tax=Sphingomonas sp. 2R-10 TaxID=3045148 RepID=UPI000F7AA9B5|nr:3-oxoacyl-[acyl-carrier-protein] synthase III C-terminal domain-containing protein [Sphingomonas sp. 2R-10]MDJ0275890.1 3-oxoacyl-[acyl-carrier-protein] synthase III C-terminal domain-containing protein [Sphingomonas sp. 2R-10]